MKITEYFRGDDVSYVEALLEGRVFHATKRAYLASIRADGYIKTNKDRRLPSTFGYLPNGYFRNRDCVSLFDYRLPDVESHRGDCWPLEPAHSEKGVAILLLSPRAYSELIPWSQWKEDGKGIEQVISYVEAGYPGPLSMELIDEIVCLKLEDDPNSVPGMLRRPSRS